MAERRSGVRIPVQLKAQVRWKSSSGAYRTAEGKTGLISGNGLFVAAPVRLRRSTPITVTVFLPKEATPVPLQLLCQGRVVRSGKTGGRSGIVATIDDYEIRPLRRRK